MKCEGRSVAAAANPCRIETTGYELFKTWEEWCAAKGEMRNLGDRRVSLPLFPDGV